jgi:hypothetical protein
MRFKCLYWYRPVQTLIAMLLYCRRLVVMSILTSLYTTRVRSTCQERLNLLAFHPRQELAFVHVSKAAKTTSKLPFCVQSSDMDTTTASFVALCEAKVVASYLSIISTIRGDSRGAMDL